MAGNTGKYYNTYLKTRREHGARMFRFPYKNHELCTKWVLYCALVNKVMLLTLAKWHNDRQHNITAFNCLSAAMAIVDWGLLTHFKTFEANNFKTFQTKVKKPVFLNKRKISFPFKKYYCIQRNHFFQQKKYKERPRASFKTYSKCHVGGCDFIEFDVTLSSDGIPIIFHDKTLERMADSNLVVNNTTYDVLKNVNLSTKHPLRERFGVTNIPTLDQTVTKLLTNGQKMIIDIKDNNRKMVPVILDLFDRYPNLYSNAIVSSFFPNIIYLLRRSNPKIVCSMAYRPYVFSTEYYKYPEGKGPNRESQFWKHYFLAFCDIINTWALHRLTYFIIGISIILLQKDCLSAKSILDWRSKGVRVMVWTVNSPIEKQHLIRNLKVTYLTDTLTGEASAHST